MALREEYKESLKELTFNSKPIINALTILAEENMEYSRIIVSVIMTHIGSAPAKHKLPALYLMDSILKNVGKDYSIGIKLMIVPLFEFKIIDTFKSMYEAVDAKDKNNMARIVKTWIPFWSTNTINQLNEFINQANKPKQQIKPLNELSSQPNKPKLPTSIDPHLLFSDVVTLMNHLNQQLLLFPQDPLLHKNLTLLQQMGITIQSQPASDMLLTQMSHQLLLIWNLPHPPSHVVSVSPIRVQETPPISETHMNINQILQQLNPISDVSKHISQPVIPNVTTASLAHTIPNLQGNPMHHPYNKIDAGNGQVEILTFENVDLQKRRDHLLFQLYERLGLQCKQCGQRFLDDIEGKQKMDAHMDWHFRTNRKMKDRGIRSYSRDWFLSEQEWIQMHNVDTTSNQAPIFFETEQQIESDVIKPLDLSGHSILMESEEDRNIPCMICKEKFEVTFDEEKDQWILENAVRFGEKLVHSTCFNESSDFSLLSSPTERKRKAEEAEEMPEKKILINKD